MQNLMLKIINILSGGLSNPNASFKDLSTGGTATPDTGATTEGSQFAATAEKVSQILGTIIGPILIALGGAAAVYCIVLGVQFARAEDDGKRAEVKKRFINCLIGALVILVLATLCLAFDWGAIVTSLFGYAG